MSYRSLQTIEVKTDRLLDAEIESVGYNGMSDAHLVEQRERLFEISEVGEVEIMSGVEAYAEFQRLFRSRDERGDGGITIGGIIVGVWLGVEFDAVGTDRGCSLDLLYFGIDEDRDSDTGIAEACHHLGEELTISHNIPTGRTGEGIGRIRHESDLCRRRLNHKVHKLGSGISLDVELSRDDLRQQVDISTSDMALVGTRMHGDALCAEALTVDSKALHIGHIFATRIAQGGNFIDIDTKSCHSKKFFGTKFVVINTREGICRVI